MTQNEINDAEWRNPDNWSDRIIGIYFSKRDTRIWVPKRIPAMGWTLNLAHPAGAWWFVGVMVAVILLITAVSILSRVFA